MGLRGAGLGGFRKLGLRGAGFGGWGGDVSVVDRGRGVEQGQVLLLSAGLG